MKKSPLQLVKDKFENKAGLVAALRTLATDDLWIDRLNEDKGLDHVSNKKLLHLHDVLSEVKSKFGTRTALVDAILDAENRSKDADYKSRFENWSTPRLWDHYRSATKPQA